jgi:hypothetical protein
MMDPLTIRDVVALNVIISAAQGCKKVARLLEDGSPVFGIARSIGTENGAFITEGEDVRDAFLRVTTQAGWEVFWPVRELLALTKSGEFSQYDW